MSQITPELLLVLAILMLIALGNGFSVFELERFDKSLGKHHLGKVFSWRNSRNAKNNQ